MLASAMLAAFYFSLQEEGIRLIEQTDRCIEKGTIVAGSQEIHTMIRYPERFLPALRRQDNGSKIGFQDWITLRRDCHDPMLKRWCYDKFAAGTPPQRHAAVFGLYLTATPEDIPILMRALKTGMNDYYAALALGKLKAEEAIPHLVARLGNSAYRSVVGTDCEGAFRANLSEGCRKALADFGPEVWPWVSPLLDPNHDRNSVMQACELARIFEIEDVCDRVYQLAQDRIRKIVKGKITFSQNEELRQLATTLDHFGDPRVGLVTKALDPRDFARRPLEKSRPNLTTVIMALDEGKPMSWQDQLIHLLRNPDEMEAAIFRNYEQAREGEKLEMLSALAYTSREEPKYGHLMLRALQSDTYTLKLYGLQGLRVFHTPDATPYILSACFDEDPRVRQYAYEVAILYVGLPAALGRPASGLH